MTLNKVMIIGNLTRDPEVRTTPNGQQVASFGVATSRQWTNQQTGQKQEQTEFHNVVAWGKLADICGQFLGKGRKVYVEGRLQTREWEGQDGAKRQRTEIVAEQMIMLDRAPQGQGAQGQSFAAPAKPSAAPSSEPTIEPAPRDEEEIKIEDIPF
ncbi:MAG: single-stranded DNA-binding protein [bacterium]|nr:single-stranded DNA-binding protein [bacterium]